MDIVSTAIVPLALFSIENLMRAMRKQSLLVGKIKEELCADDTGFLGHANLVRVELSPIRIGRSTLGFTRCWLVERNESLPILQD